MRNGIQDMAFPPVSGAFDFTITMDVTFKRTKYCE